MSWSIIYCPNEGGHRRWKKIRRYLEERGVDYDYVQSDGPGAVERLASMMARHGVRNIIVVGGDAALSHALCGIVRSGVPREEWPRLGVIPGGYGNDFARYWGMEIGRYKETIDHLIEERVRRIDIGVLRILPNTAVPTKRAAYRELAMRIGMVRERVEPLQEEYFLNCLNIGTVASIIDFHRSVAKVASKMWGLHPLAYLFGTIAMLFRRKRFHYKFTTGGEHVDRYGMTLCIGSAHGYGQTPSAVPYNGQLDLSLVSHPRLTHLFHGLWLLYTGRFLGHRGVSVWRSRHIRFDEGMRHAPMSLDGRVITTPEGPFEVTILPEAIDFLY